MSKIFCPNCRGCAVYRVDGKERCGDCSDNKNNNYCNQCKNQQKIYFSRWMTCSYCHGTGYITISEQLTL